MRDPVITEFTGMRRDTVRRIYQYGGGGVRVYTGKNALRRIYRFDPDANIMTERDIRREDRVVRRFLFDNYGMLAETFAFGERPHNYHYEDGARRIVVRDGGERGAVGKTFLFEGQGISETAWGRDGEIERVYVFEPGNGSIVVRLGGWYGDVDRNFIFEGINASLFREPEAFLQFLMFTDLSEEERDELPRTRPAESSRVDPVAPAASAACSKYAYTGIRHTPNDYGGDTAGSGGSLRPVPRGRQEDEIPGRANPVSFDERWQSATAQRYANAGKPPERSSSPIPFNERWDSATSRNERPLPGRSGDGTAGPIPFSERWESATSQKERPLPGRSGDRNGSPIPFDERWQSATNRDNPPARPTTGRPSRDISFEERKSGELTPRDPHDEDPGNRPSREISYEERRQKRR